MDARALAQLVDVEADGTIALWGEGDRPAAYFVAPPAFTAWLQQVVAACKPEPTASPAPIKSAGAPCGRPEAPGRPHWNQ